MTIDTDIDEISTEAHDKSHFRALESRALKGTFFTVASYGTSMGVRLASSIILTRAFCPRNSFGLMTLLMTIIVGLNLFSHIGFQDSVIQHSRGDDESFLNTAWTIQALRGVGLWLVMVIVAWPVAHFYDQRLLWLLPFVGFGAIISGFRSPKLLSLSRHLRTGKIVTPGSSSASLTQYIVAIGLGVLRHRSIRATRELPGWFPNWCERC